MFGAVGGTIELSGSPPNVPTLQRFQGRGSWIALNSEALEGAEPVVPRPLRPCRKGNHSGLLKPP